MKQQIGIILPGQGSQFMGMGKDLYDSERIVQELFEQASNCLNQNFVKLCFAASDKELRQTVNAQTAIFLISSAIYAILNQKYEIKPDLIAGHSSGEYTAIYSAGGMTFPDALYLLNKRATFMQEHTINQNGGMLAVIGMPKEVLETICLKYDNPESEKHVAQIVNYNSQDQLVVSGTMPELEAIKFEVRKHKAKPIMLNVEGAFHSRLMKEAEKNFNLYLVKVDIQDLSTRLVNNVNADIVFDKNQVKNSLAKQISSPVLWWQSMQHFKDMDLILEVGPSGKLSSLLKKEWPEKNIMSVSNVQELYDLLNFLEKKILCDKIEEGAMPDEIVKDNIQEKSKEINIE
ncbi:ACP S-malonyltransferase [Candidatus Babeliales bacterium]|nr:ACP S-malonyltransferase [Candidatus Babeliales bacterium]MCF7899257.1 ACP S-malonyltransferase [Candidatus Babeliales bacterium]